MTQLDWITLAEARREAACEALAAMVREKRESFENRQFVKHREAALRHTRAGT